MEKLRDSKKILALIPIAFLVALMWAAPVTASHDLSGHGEFLVKSVSNHTCTWDPSHTVRTCSADYSGSIKGTLTGSFEWSVTAIFTYVSTTPPVFVTLTQTGILTCDPCTVAGLTGTLTLATSASGTLDPPSTFYGTLTVTGSSGDLAGTTGTGTFHSAADPPAQEYSVPLALP